MCERSWTLPTIYDLKDNEVHNPRAAIDNAEALTKALVAFIHERTLTEDRGLS